MLHYVVASVRCPREDFISCCYQPHHTQKAHNILAQPDLIPSFLHLHSRAVSTLCEYLQFPMGKIVRRPGIEPGSQEWESCMIPLHQRRLCNGWCDYEKRNFYVNSHNAVKETI